MKFLFIQKNIKSLTCGFGKKRGFTLIEAFIAITIIMVVIIGPLTLAQKGLSSAAYAKDKVTGYYLAQDAIEYIHWIRDQAVLKNPPGTGWAAFEVYINPCLATSCRADSSNFNLSSPNLFLSCSVNNPCTSNLQYNNVTGLYGYDDMNLVYGPGSTYVSADGSVKLVWTPSVFHRTISVNPVSSSGGDEFQIVVTISFSGKNEPPVVMTDNVYNWK
jgi:Tfp pilus assembly protein PilV